LPGSGGDKPWRQFTSLIVQIGSLHYHLGYTIDEAIADTERRLGRLGHDHEKVRDELEADYERSLHSEF
jgi:hypothetical protein